MHTRRHTGDGAIAGRMVQSVLVALALLVNLLTLTNSAQAVAVPLLAAPPPPGVSHYQCAPGPDYPGGDCIQNLFPYGWTAEANLGPFYQGDVIPYRALFRKLVAGVSYVLTIEYDTTQGGQHALDYLTTFSHTIATANACSDYAASATCADVHTYAIPADPQVAAGYDEVHGTADDIAQLPGVLTLYGGTITSVSLVGGDVPFVPDSSRRLAVTFTADVDNKVVLAWGGHTATQSDWQGHAQPTGLAYSMRFSDFQCTTNDCSTSPQELQVIAGAVVQSGAIIVVKDTLPDALQDFSFQVAGQGLADFQLDDDGGPGSGGDDVLPSQITFWDLVPNPSYQVTETATVGWYLSALACVDPTDDTATSLIGRRASIDISAGEAVTCTFTNEPLTGSWADVTITETVSPPTVQEPGGAVTFTIMTVNEAMLDVTLDSLIDDALGDLHGRGDCQIPQLLTAQGGSYSCSYSDFVGGNAGYVHSSTVTATASNAMGSVVVTDSTMVTVTNLASSILVTKTAYAPVVSDPGAAAQFTLTVHNTSAADLVALDQITDDEDQDGAIDAVYDPGGICDRTSLLAGETATCVLSHAVFGSPGDVITDVATAWGTDDDGETVSHTDTASVAIADPGIEIQKGPDFQRVPSGMSANFQITVTNVGNVELTGVQVLDANAPSCEYGPVSLPQSGQLTYSCAVTVTDGFTNTATVSGSDLFGHPVSDADVAVVDASDAAILIDKGPDSQYVRAGGSARFNIDVANAGNVDLTMVRVSDPQVPDCDYGPVDLAVGQAASYSCIATVSASFTNTATVSAEDLQGRQIGAADAALVAVIEPSIVITKSPSHQYVRVGQRAVFGVRVHNTGNVTLDQVTVSDSGVPSCDYGPLTLASGEQVSYSCMVTVTADFTSMAIVSGRDPLGGSVSDSDQATVDAINPSILVIKSPELQRVRVGRTVTFTMDLQNLGDVGLTNVTVSDPEAPDCDFGPVGLAVGEHLAYTCSMVVSVDVSTDVTAIGQDPAGGVVTDTDGALVDAISPAMRITKSPSFQQVLVGEVVTFTVNVKNTGDVALGSVVISDPLAADCEADVGTLGIGGDFTSVCAMAVDESFTNLATATGDDPNGEQVQVSATAQVSSEPVAVYVPVLLGDYVAPQPDLSTSTKQVDAFWANGGETLAYTITVHNTGSKLADVSLTDPVPASTTLLGTVTGGVYQNGQVEWHGQLDTGAIHTVTFAVRLDQGASGVITNVAAMKYGHGVFLQRTAATQLMVVNPRFETGDLMGWQHGGQLPQAVRSTEPHSGRYSALLGDPNPTCKEHLPSDGDSAAWMEQTSAVPGEGTPELSFWYRIHTWDHLYWSDDDPKPVPERTLVDSFDVYINGVRILRDNYDNYPDKAPGCGNEQDLGWQRFSYDLSAYRGQQITLRFENYNRVDGWYSTWTYVDDVLITY